MAITLECLRVERGSAGTARRAGSTPVLKYNIWRRVAGSMDAFVKIGETSTLTFDDVTPGKFEYEVTPVR